MADSRGPILPRQEPPGLLEQFQLLTRPGFRERPLQQFPRRPRVVIHVRCGFDRNRVELELEPTYLSLPLLLSAPRCVELLLRCIRMLE